MVQAISFKLLYIVEETDVVDPPTMTTSLSGTARNDKYSINTLIKQVFFLAFLLYQGSTKFLN